MKDEEPMMPMLWRIFICTRAVFAFADTLASGETPPNDVLIVADNMGWADLGCYGNDLHETPHLDRLAQQGVRFTDAYAASPVCTPTRAATHFGPRLSSAN